MSDEYNPTIEDYEEAIGEEIDLSESDLDSETINQVLEQLHSG